MVRATAVTGAVLVLLGAVGYIVTGATSLTALIPSLVGSLLLVCAAIGRSRPAIGEPAALVVALLGALGSLMNVARIGEVFAGTAERPAAVVVSTLMLLVLVAHLVVGVRWFLAQRRARSGR